VNEQLPSDQIAEIRAAVADYMWSEGCDCCRGKKHDEHKARLAKLLNVEPYDDHSGFDFYQYSPASKKAK
jgi:hypothetical protein